MSMKRTNILLDLAKEQNVQIKTISDFYKFANNNPA